tara:strand:+ start:65 stop:688 length:624 start_codon:yes stop_codon:yes gene_type:complete
MSLYNSICCDNFFDEPDKIVDLSKTLSFHQTDKIRGLRSQALHEVNNNFFKYVNWKIINNIYPGVGSIEFNASTFFQKSIQDNCDGWVHEDKSWITSIIYLTKEGTSGTSLFKKKNEYDLTPQPEKYEYFENPKSKNKEDILKKKIENNNKYRKTISFTGDYNRLIAFNGNTPHAADVDLECENRLVLISFINYIKVDHFPNVNFNL